MKVITMLSPSVSLALLILLALVAGHAPIVEAANQERVHLARAMAYEDTGDLRSALIEYRNTLRINPDNVGARIRYGHLQFRIGELSEGRQNLEQALQRGANRDDILLDLGQIYLRLGDYDKLLGALHPGDGRTPSEQARVLTLRGYAQMALNDYTSARLSFEDALVRQPDEAGALVGLGQLAAFSGDLEQIQQVIDKGRKFESQDAFVWVLMGQLEQQAGNYQQAAAAFQKALTIDPNRLEAQIGMMLTRFVQQQLGEAHDWADRVLKASPNNAAAHLILARIAIAESRLPAARDYLRQATDVSPEYADALLLYASVSYDLGEYERALSLVKRFLSGNEDHLAARKLMAMIQLTTGEPEQALWGVEPLLLRYPTDGQLLALAIKAAIQSNKLTQARAHSDHSLELALPEGLHTQLARIRTLLADDHGVSEVTPLLDALIANYQQETRTGLARQAMIELQSHNYAKAREHAQQLVDKQTPDPDAHLLSGMASLAAGDLKASRDSIEAILQLRPDNITATNALANLDLLGGDLDRARKRYQQVRELDAHNFDAIMGLARVASTQGRRDDAVGLLEQACSEFPDATAPRLILGWIYLREGKIDKATALAGELKSLAAKEPQILDFRGFVQATNGQLDAALSNLEAAAKGQPNSTATLYRLALVQVANKQREAAKDTYRKILALDPAANRAAVRLVQLALAAEQYDQALEVAEQLRPHRPAFGRMLEGDVYRAQGDQGKALSAYLRAASAARAFTPTRKADTVELLLPRLEGVADKAVQQTQSVKGLRLLAPESRDVDDLEGRFMLKRQEPELAAIFYRRKQQEHPDEVLWTLRLAEAQRQTLDKLAASQTLRDWLLRHPEDIRVRLALAEQQMADGASTQAIDQYLQIVEIDPDNVMALNNAAWLSVEQNPRRALEYASRAAEQDPDAQVLHTLGRALRHNGKPQQAVTVLRRSYRAAPDNADIGYELAEALFEAGNKHEARTLLGKLLESDNPFRSRASAQALFDKLVAD